MDSLMKKYRLIQCSGHGTASTLLANVLTGFFFEKEQIHWLSISKPYDSTLTNFITKTHKLDIDMWLTNQPQTPELFFIMSERKSKVPDKDRNRKQVLVYSYDELLETDNNSVEQIVTNIYNKLIHFLPNELMSMANVNRGIQRLKDMNAFYETIQEKPFKFFDKYYHLHGSHRNRTVRTALGKKLDDFTENIPEIRYPPLKWIFGKYKLRHMKDTLWLEFGVFKGISINHIAQFSDHKVYGFDSFVGLPEKWREGYDKGHFNRKGNLPAVRENVELVKGWFNETLEPFLKNKNQKITFMHIDCDIYSSTKYVLNTTRKYLAPGCVIIFDELVNYPGYKDNGELKAFYEFVIENKITFEWLGMFGKIGMTDVNNQKVAVKILSV